MLSRTNPSTESLCDIEVCGFFTFLDSLLRLRFVFAVSWPPCLNATHWYMGHYTARESHTSTRNTAPVPVGNGDSEGTQGCAGCPLRLLPRHVWRVCDRVALLVQICARLRSPPLSSPLQAHARIDLSSRACVYEGTRMYGVRYLP